MFAFLLTIRRPCTVNIYYEFALILSPLFFSPSDVVLLLGSVKNSQTDRQKLQEHRGEFGSQSCLFKAKKVVTRVIKISGQKHNSKRPYQASEVKHWYCEGRGRLVGLSLGRQDELMTEEMKAQLKCRGGCRNDKIQVKRLR